MTCGMEILKKKKKEERVGRSAGYMLWAQPPPIRQNRTGLVTPIVTAPTYLELFRKIYSTTVVHYLSRINQTHGCKLNELSVYRLRRRALISVKCSSSRYYCVSNIKASRCPCTYVSTCHVQAQVRTQSLIFFLSFASWTRDDYTTINHTFVLPSFSYTCYRYDILLIQSTRKITRIHLPYYYFAVALC